MLQCDPYQAGNVLEAFVKKNELWHLQVRHENFSWTSYRNSINASTVFFSHLLTHLHETGTAAELQTWLRLDANQDKLYFSRCLQENSEIQFACAHQSSTPGIKPSDYGVE